MSRLQKNQSGFSAIEALLILVIVGVVGFTGWYVWHAKQNADKNLATSSSTTPKNKKKTIPVKITDPTAGWTPYASTSGKFSLKYPKTWVTAVHPELCSDGILLLGANSESVGACASENFGQVAISWVKDSPCLDLNGDTYTSITKEAVVVSSVSGVKQTATAKPPGEGPGGLPEGTKVTNYCFTSKGTTYTANYVQLSTYPDVLADFNLMVTKTLKFE